MDIRKLCMKPREEFEDWCRVRAAAFPLNAARALCRLFGQYPFYVDSTDVHVSPHLILDGYWESWVAMAVAKLVQPTWRCIDVGANYGIFTVLLSKLASAGHVHAFEPNSRTFEFLSENIRINGCHNATAVHKAVGDSESVGSLRWQQGNPGSASLTVVPDHPYRGEELWESAAITRLDVTPFGRVDFIKIDAEGMDYEVIRGAQKLLADNPACCILFEHAGFLLGGETLQHDLLQEAMAMTGGRLHECTYDGQWKPVAASDVSGSDPNRVWNLLLARSA